MYPTNKYQRKIISDKKSNRKNTVNRNNKKLKIRKTLLIEMENEMENFETKICNE